MFTCKAIGHIDLNSKKFTKSKNEAWLSIVPSQKRNYIYYGNGKSATSEIKYMSFEDGDFKYYAMQGGYVGFNEDALSAVVIVPAKNALLVYTNCEESDSMDKFSEEASELLNAAEDAHRLNESMQTH